MLISDCSSDVCSSDLLTLQIALCLIFQLAPDLGIGFESLEALGKRNRLGHGRSTLLLRAQVLSDRKSVVSGKSVSVRVDLGGRSIMKTTQKIAHTHIR